MTKKFVIFIDTQVDFMVEGAALYVAGAEPLISKLNNFAYHLDPTEIEGVLFTYDTHHEATYKGSEEAKQFPIHCVERTPGWHNVVNENIINREIPIFTLCKNVFNMWEEEDLFLNGSNIEEDHDREYFFENLKLNGINDIIVVGVAADFCVKWAIDGLVERGFNVEIPLNLTAGIIRDIYTVIAEDFIGKNVKAV